LGMRAWDYFARAAGGADRLRARIDAAPCADDFWPASEDGAPLTVADIEAAPPAALSRLLDLLRKELPPFLRGDEANSGIELSRGRLTLTTLRSSITDRKASTPILMDRAVLIADATPQAPLVLKLAATNGLSILPSFAPNVTLPPNVKITQIADAFFGKSTLNRIRKLRDGSEQRPGRDTLLANLMQARRDYPGDKEAVLCPKSLKPDVVALGIPADRVLTFFGNRGLNAIADCDVLHVLGRPQAPDRHALRLANLLHQGESPISPHMIMAEVAYAGYRGPDGLGRAITVPTFEDPRAADCLEASRGDELLQSLHRARLFLIANSQTSMFEPAGVDIARSAKQRTKLRVVLHTSQPVTGLRVDELIYTPTGLDPNTKRHNEALARIRAAVTQLEAEGVPVSAAAVARVSGASRNTAAAALREILDTARGRLTDNFLNRLRGISTNWGLAGFTKGDEPVEAAVTAATRPEIATTEVSPAQQIPGGSSPPAVAAPSPVIAGRDVETAAAFDTRMLPKAPLTEESGRP
jgi:hypothetical protein